MILYALEITYLYCQRTRICITLKYKYSFKYSVCLNVYKLWWPLLVEQWNCICLPLENSHLNWIHTIFWKEKYSVQCHKFKLIFGKATYREIDSLHHTVTCRQVADEHKIISNYCTVAWCSIQQWSSTAVFRSI
jgi:hypothetical protein